MKAPVPLRCVTGLFVVIALAGRVVVAEKGAAPSAPLFPVERLETELKRGVSSKADVERVLGRPTGRGSALFPGDAHPSAAAYEIWYYLDYRTRGVSGTTARGQRITILDIVPDMLLVFFNKETFDGFSWFSQVGAEPR